MSSNRAAGLLRDPYDVIFRPILTEKTHVQLPTGLDEGEEHRARYVFEVHPRATKHQIRRAIEYVFDVDVASVNTMIQKPKRKSFRMATGRGGVGFTRARKKAVVRLEPGSPPIDLI